MKLSEIRERLQKIRSCIINGDAPEDLIIMEIDELLEEMKE